MPGLLITDTTLLKGNSPVATYSPSSSRYSATLEQELSQQGRTHLPETPARAKQGLARNLIVSCARKLHDWSFAFPALVKTFRALQGLGFNLTPNHFYWPVPDLAELEQRDWAKFSPPPGCTLDLRKQVELAWELAAHYGDECRFSSEPQEHSYHYNNGYFEAVDAEVAYCLVRHFKPARIMEIGTGYSTRVLAAALKKNSERDHLDGKLISVDPNPERFSPNGWKDMVIQISKPVQDVDVKFFDRLGSGDILFIDSSHVVGVGTDVVREYLEILPRLRPGVIVHFHDIFLPSDYPRDAVLNRLWFWSEQYLLQAFLTFNSQFEVLWASSAMHLEHPTVLEHCFPRWRSSYIEMPESKRRFVPTLDSKRVWPSSFWMRRV
jgi:predicted O-methyltransferase YrrM